MTWSIGVLDKLIQYVWLFSGMLSLIILSIMIFDGVFLEIWSLKWEFALGVMGSCMALPVALLSLLKTRRKLFQVLYGLHGLIMLFLSAVTFASTDPGRMIAIWAVLIATYALSYPCLFRAGYGRYGGSARVD